MALPVDESTILTALRHVPSDRWGEVLAYLHTLSEPVATIRTAGDLVRSGLVGMWADRDDLGETRDYARRLRHEAETRAPAGGGPT
jgi:hypothetical protein